MNISDWKVLPPDVIKLFRKYRIISEQEVGPKKVEGYTQVNLRRARDAEGKTLGDGPLIAMDVLTRFVNACLVDEKVDCAWLDWIFFQVGGGQESMRRANQAMEQVKERFLDERMRGFRDTKGAYHAPITREAAQAKWVGSDPRFQEVLFVCDQDMSEKLCVFGFHRNWPGPTEIYRKASAAVREFLDLAANIAEMNAFLRKNEQTDKIVPTDVKHYGTVDVLETAIKKVQRFFNSRAARQDIRIEKVYSDALVDVICPLSYAASVRYGWDAWPHSDRSIFEQCLEGNSTAAWNDPWRKMTGQDGKIAVFFNFKLPMPSWITYEKSKFDRVTLSNVCVVLPKGALTRLNPTCAEFFDEENRKVTIEAICGKIRDEPKRDCNPENEEYPILIGPRVFETDEQAEAVVRSFELAWDSIVAWASKFNIKHVVADYMPK